MTNQTIMEGVFKVLEKHPEARDNYNWLWYWYCHDIANIKIYVPWQALDYKEIPSVESITRACRKLQNEQGNFKPSFAVQQARSEKEVQVKEWATKGFNDYQARIEVVQ